MKNICFNLMPLFLAATVFVSCSKEVLDENMESSKIANSTLKVRAGAIDDSKGEISYPINVYIFDQADKCVDTKTLKEGDKIPAFKLPSGMYNVYAIAGADDENYTLPTKDTASPESIISLNEGKEHGDLMVAEGNVTLDEDETNTLFLPLSRKVMMVEEIELTLIPSSVTGVSLTISPLYGNLKLNGDYDGSNESKTIQLDKNDENQWICKDSVYLLPVSGRASIKITLTKSDADHVSYTASTDKDLSANHKITLKGKYDSGLIDMEGSIKGAEWEAPIEINFEFGKVDEPDESPEISGDVPAVGSLYKGAYVLRHTKSGNGTLITLMSPKENTEWKFKKQDDLPSEVDAKLREWNAGEVTGWRLPDKDEIEYLYTHAEKVNIDFNALKKTDEGKNLDGFYYSDSKILFKDSDGSTIKTMDKNLEVFDSIGHGVTTVLRAFATITISE